MKNTLKRQSRFKVHRAPDWLVSVADQPVGCSRGRARQYTHELRAQLVSWISSSVKKESL